MSSPQAVLAMSSADARAAAVRPALEGGVTPSDLAGAFAQDSVSVATGLPLLLAMLDWAFHDDCPADAAMDICQAVLSATGRRLSAYGEAVVRAREILTDLYALAERPKDALMVLVHMPTDNGLRSSSDEYKVSLFVRIAEFSLEVENDVQAENYVKKAWTLIRNVSDKDLVQRFEVCHAMVSDVNRRFLEAAQRFYALSQHLEDESEALDALQKAIIAIVLDDAGPARSRLIATIFRDERTAACGELGAILAKVYHERVLRTKDVTAIAPYLKPHHKAVRADGRTVFDNAMTQHNLLSASKLYFNISFAELGVLLGVDPEVAEEIAAQMIAEDRLRATIDQVSEVINFQATDAAAIELWDAQIATACQGISLVASDLQRRHPELAASA